MAEDILINLTPHPITDVVAGLKIPPSGEVARVETSQEVSKTITVNGKKVTIYRTKYNGEPNLPAPQEGVYYIVSAVVINALAERGIERDDVIAPHLLVRDSGGTPRGCGGFRLNG
jgi:hypothetical protein